MPVFINPDGTTAYPTHRCISCNSLLLRAAGLECEECLRHNGRHATQLPDKPTPPTVAKPKIDWNTWGIHK